MVGREEGGRVLAVDICPAVSRYWLRYYMSVEKKKIKSKREKCVCISITKTSMTDTSKVSQLFSFIITDKKNIYIFNGCDLISLRGTVRAPELKDPRDPRIHSY